MEYWIVVARELETLDRVDVVDEARSESYGLGLPGHDPLTGLPDRRLFELPVESGDAAVGRARQLQVRSLFHRP